MARELERAISAFRRRRPPATGDLRSLVHGDDASFRAAVDVRLQNLERQLDELKGRINGLLFLLAGAVATNVVLRLLA
jgi:hypothetical protein